MEELRPCMADRFVLTLINNKVMGPDDFETAESGAVTMTDDGRRKLLRSWQERKQEVITHPYLQEKLPWGLVPYMQALLLARHLRADLDAYPPVFVEVRRERAGIDFLRCEYRGCGGAKAPSTNCKAVRELRPACAELGV